MGTACSSDKFKISPTASTCELLNCEHPLILVAHQCNQNIDLIGELEAAPIIVQQYGKKLKDSSQVLKPTLERLENEEENFLKVWNLIVSILKNVSSLIKKALQEPQFIEYLPIISYNLQEQQNDLEMLINQKKGQQQIKRAQSHIIQTKVIRINKRHQTDKI
ncbi:unnamed protein product [Paramecium octaurelia]|uniref:Uncharacterized protein n=1 Tax=Paramecium octaurelia TaxID=43137 RepID=A0A8S1S2S5_PAROT|nr:unnamed protein product [Paramecium octaurelia]CAD8133981.1 unnamed protein product [Paramecium octaurelia]